MYTTSKNAIDRAGAAVVSTITSLKGSFNTKRFVGPIWTAKEVYSEHKKRSIYLYRRKD